jgi:hypothetical protein
VACEGDALDGEEFLGVGGLVVVDEAGLDVSDSVEIFGADGGESGKVEGGGVGAGGFGRGGVVGGFAGHVLRYCFITGARGKRGRELVWDWE